MIMDSDLHKILHKIKLGESTFDAKTHSEGDIKKFQLIAKAILHAKKMGYIQNIYPHQSSLGGQRYYDTILVTEGLTYEGELALQKTAGQPTPTDEALSGLLFRLESHTIREKWEKAMHRRYSDPSGAITASRSLLETTLKWIIEKRGKQPDTNNQKLFEQAIRELGIEIENASMKKIIEGLNLVIWGIGDMRNKHGDAHGLSQNNSILPEIEAGLCVSLAGSASLYLLEKFETNSKMQKI